MEDRFDPAVHRVVAVVADGPEKGTHVHVALEEIARDARHILENAPWTDSGAAFNEIRARIAGIERAVLDQERAMQAVLQALDDQTTLFIEDGAEGLRLPLNKVVQKILSTTVIVPRES